MPTNQRPHVIMVILALQGHMNPMLNFAKRLVARGIYVTLITTELARERMLKNKTLTTQNTNPQNPRINLEFFSDGLSVDFDRDANLAAFLTSMRNEGTKNLSNLMANLTKSITYSCAIISPFILFTIDAVINHGIPVATLWIQASAVYAIYHRYFSNPNSFPANLENPNGVVELSALPKMEVKYLPSFILPSSPGSPPCMKQIMVDFVQSLTKVKWVLGTSFSELEGEIEKSVETLAPIYSIGPLVSPFLMGEKDMYDDFPSVNMWKAEDSCIDWLDSKPPCSIIYVSFGSIIVMSEKQKEQIALALKNSNRPFLWVVKSGEVPKWFVEETKEKGLVVSWCPQEKVLLHKAIGCFVTHCGWNSTLEAMVAGVPMVAYPKWSDQPMTALLLEEVFKNAVKVRNWELEDGPEAEEVEKSIREVMEGPRAQEIRKRAIELKEAAKRALEEKGSSYQNFNNFICKIS